MKVLMVLATALFCAAANAQDWPARPLRLVVPYPTGGLTDVLARALSDRLATALKQPVLVENKPGAGTLLGAEMVARAGRPTATRSCLRLRRRSASARRSTRSRRSMP